MADDRTNNNDPDSEIPELGGLVFPVAGPDNTETLTNKLGPTIDKIRQIASNIGIREYRVFLVHAEWSGGVRGRGSPTEISRREILPQPRVQDATSTAYVVRAFGLQEEGTIVIDRISGKYTEDDLTGRTPDLEDPVKTRSGQDGLDFYWEVVEAADHDPKPVPRRYVPSAVPARLPFQWKVVLTKQEMNAPRSLPPTPTNRRFR